jgi:hypothetical protein
MCLKVKLFVSPGFFQRKKAECDPMCLKVKLSVSQGFFAEQKRLTEKDINKLSHPSASWSHL